MVPLILESMGELGVGLLTHPALVTRFCTNLVGRKIIGRSYSSPPLYYTTTFFEEVQ